MMSMIKINILYRFADKQEFLDSVMIYMPPAHAQFIRELRKQPHIRQFG